MPMYLLLNTRFRWSLLLLSFLIISGLFAQDNEQLIDQLEKSLKESKAQYPEGDEVQIDLYIQLINLYSDGYHKELEPTLIEAQKLANKYDNDELKITAKINR